MVHDVARVKSIFLAAVERYPAEQWPAYLDEACGEDTALRERVEELLGAHGGQKGLDVPAPSQPGATVDQLLEERPGTSIGPYKLLEQIGEGGMGSVYMAEQAHPVRRRVALKVIKAGMDTRQVVARFEAERQALALMDHPNIARVLDAGATESGRPYFVMELVQGIPITDHCDQARLSIAERLGLFVTVCRAVQHAHQKGIIHRDLKPSNVLVTLHDGVPAPKVIDFGVAKATGQRLTEMTLFTAFAHTVGTPLYMSPEQVGTSGVDIDTRSDIYSLGVLLYELLTGSTPLSPKRVREAAHAEVLRMIKEEEPPKPSTRLSDSGEVLASISAQRHMEPAKLAKLVRGELDWIVMKALEKDRNRRYESANGFAMDVQRYLADEPVLACPPSAWYRFRKFARRHKAALATVGLVGAMIIVSLVGLSIGLVLISRERDEARVQRQRADTRFRLALRAVDELKEVRGNLQSTAGPERTAKLQRAVTEDLLRFYLQIVENIEDDPAITCEAGDIYHNLSEHYASDPVRRDQAFFKALALYERQAKKKPNDPKILNALAYHYSRLASGYLGKEPERAEATYRQALDLYEQVAREHSDLIDDWVLIIDVAIRYGGLLRSQGRSAETGALDRRVLAWFERPECDLKGLNEGNQRDYGLDRLSDLLVRCGKPLKAIPVLEQARPLLVFDSQYAYYSEALTNLCLTLAADPQPAVRARAVALARENVEFLLRTDAQTWLLLGLASAQAGNLEGSDEAFRRGIELNGGNVGALNGLAWQLASNPRFWQARPSFAVRLAERAAGLKPQDAAIWNTLGVARYRAGNWKAAIEALERSETLAPGKSLDFNAFFLAMAHWRLGENEVSRRLYDQAVTWMDKNAAQNDELLRFRAEAAALLGLNDPDPGKLKALTPPEPPSPP